MAEDAKGGLPVLSFRDAAAFEAWLAAHPAAPGVWIKLAKQGSGATTLSKDEAIDCALMHGWIDGQIGRWDDVFHVTRFTPRKAGSRWSRLNCSRVERLLAAGQMTAAGLAQVEAAQADGRWAAAYPSASAAEIPEDFCFAMSPEAAAAFAALDGANRYAMLYRLHHAKDRAQVIERLLRMLASSETFHPLRKAARRQPARENSTPS